MCLAMFERCVFFNSNALVRKLNHRWEEAYRDVGLAPSHGCFLRLVLQKPGINQHEIAEALILEKSTVTRFVEKLETDGWVVRELDKRDRRIKCVVPTGQLRELEKKLFRISDELYESMSDLLGEKELKDFVGLIRKYSQLL